MISDSWHYFYEYSLFTECDFQYTLAESTFPFHLCPDNDLIANCEEESKNKQLLYQQQKKIIQRDLN